MSFLDEIDGIDDAQRQWHVEDNGIALSYDADFLPSEEADRLFAVLSRSLPWYRDTINMAGGPVAVPRLTSWHADEGRPYRYSGLVHPAQAWTAELNEVRDRLEARLGVRFNGVLGNLYESERDSVSPHADDERDLVALAPIASVSLGAVRQFVVRHRTTKSRHVVDLAHGSLIVMGGATQRVADHAIPKLKTTCGPRVNLTFRLMQ
jgi:alkylated DNA repair dioxygenase AlkB